MLNGINNKNIPQILDGEKNLTLMHMAILVSMYHYHKKGFAISKFIKNLVKSQRVHHEKITLQRILQRDLTSF